MNFQSLFPFLRRPSPAALKFKGVHTTTWARKEFLSGNDVWESLQRDPDPYLGEVPHALNLTDADKSVFLKALDALGQTLSRFDLALFTENKPHCPIWPLDHPGFEFPPVRVNTAIGPFGLEDIGHGMNATVYRLTFRDQSFALKVFYDGMPNHQVKLPYTESAIGLFTSGKGAIQDLAGFYAANPQAQWLLSEFIDPNRNPEPRSGPTLSDAGFSFGDDHVVSNRIHGVRVDYGTIRYKKKATYVPPPETGLSDLIRHCPPAVQKTKTYEDCTPLVKRDPSLLKYAYAKYSIAAPPEERLDILRWALQFPEAANNDVYLRLIPLVIPAKDHLDAIRAMADVPALRSAIPFKLGLFKGAARAEVADLIRSLPECLPWRIYHGERELLPEFFRHFCPSLDVTVLPTMTSTGMLTDDTRDQRMAEEDGQSPFCRT